MSPNETYEEGDVVLLAANPEEGWPAQPARVLGWDPDGKTLVVQVDSTDDQDDGLREITPDQIANRL